MARKSFTAQQIRDALAADPTLKVFKLDTNNAGKDDIFLGHDYGDVLDDVLDLLADDHGYGPEEYPSRLPDGWSLKEIPSRKVEDYLNSL